MAKKIIRLDSAFLSGGRKMFADGQLMPGFLRLNKSADDEECADLFIYGDIGGWWDGISAEQCCKDIAAMDVKRINCRINSGGGVINEGIAIYNALARHSAHVTMHIEGMAASIASVIPMAGDEIVMAAGARMMIHDPWSITAGSAAVFRKEADILDGLKSDIVDLYEARTGGKRTDLEQMMSDETWMSAQEAVDNGFADSCAPAKTKPDAAAASAMMSLYRNMPMAMRGQGTATTRELEDTLHSGGFSRSQAKAMASAATNRISGGARRDAAPSPRRDAGEAQELVAALNNLVKLIR